VSLDKAGLGAVLDGPPCPLTVGVSGGVNPGIPAPEAPRAARAECEDSPAAAAEYIPRCGAPNADAAPGAPKCGGILLAAPAANAADIP